METIEILLKRSPKLCKIDFKVAAISVGHPVYPKKEGILPKRKQFHETSIAKHKNLKFVFREIETFLKSA